MDLLTQTILFYRCLLHKLTQNGIRLHQPTNFQLEVYIWTFQTQKLQIWDFDFGQGRSAALRFLFFFIREEVPLVYDYSAFCACKIDII